MSLMCKWLPMGTDAWRKYSEWLDHWRLSKRMKSFILEGTNPAHKHVSSQMNVISRPTPSNLVKDVLAHLSQDGMSSQSVRKWPHTPGPKRVRSTDRKDTKPSAYSSLRTPSREGWRGRSSSAEGWFHSRDGPLHCYHCKRYGHFAKSVSGFL